MNTTALFQYDLPTRHLSTSQVSKWAYSKREYYKRYFEGIKDTETPVLRFGIQFADNMEALHDGEQPPHDIPGFMQVAEQLSILGVAERHMVHELDAGLSFQGFLDTSTPDLTQVYDYKTGARAWSQERAEQSGQLLDYAIMVYEQYDIIPEVGIEWAETQYKAGGAIIELTGRVETFYYQPTLNMLQGRKANLIATAKEITRNYKAWKGETVREAILNKYAQADARLKYYKEEVERLKLEWIEHMKGHGVSRYEGERGTFQEVVQKRWKPIDEYQDRYKNEMKEIKDRYKNEGLMEQVEVPTFRWIPQNQEG